LEQPGTLIGLGALIVVNIGAWIQTYWRGRAEANKAKKMSSSVNGDLKEIKGQVTDVAEKVQDIHTDITIVKTKISAMRKTCQRHEKEIDENRRAIVELIKNGTGRK